jgi:hypothetical protein
MKPKTWSAVVICTTVLALLAGPAWCGEEKGGGTVTYGPAEVENQSLPDGSMIQRSHIKGIVLSSDASSAMHLVAQDCFGTTLVSPSGVATGNGYCDAVDGDGDRYWIWWHNGPRGNTWGFMGGTGKFEDVEGGGTTEQLAQMADGRVAITCEGTWTRK